LSYPYTVEELPKPCILKIPYSTFYVLSGVDPEAFKDQQIKQILFYLTLQIKYLWTIEQLNDSTVIHNVRQIFVYCHSVEHNNSQTDAWLLPMQEEFIPRETGCKIG
jgi:hypothetical protein